MRTWRAHQPAAAGSRPGDVVALTDDDARHLSRVLRLRPGDAVAVFDGAGTEWSGALVEISPRRATVRIAEKVEGRVDPGLDVILWQALCRPERVDWVVQKATEIGAAEIRLFAAARSEGRTPGGARLARWGRIAIEASKQCGRRRVPAVRLAGAPDRPDGDRLAVALDPRPTAPPFGTVLPGRRPSAVSLAVGPEGGFEEAEIERLVAHGWVAARLGPRVLRTETAGVVALTLTLFAWDDLGPARSGPGLRGA